MSDQEHINDELLSAYLDDELAPAERAKVEGRLAADPAARQMLEQLRSVSQSVRSLPSENVGRDLRETILRRAVQAKAIDRATPERAPQAGLVGARRGEASRPPTAKPAPAQRAAASPASSASALFSHRWAWSALALAATVLLVIALPLINQERELSPVAHHDQRSDAPAASHRGLIPSSGLPARQPADALESQNADKNPAAEAAAPNANLSVAGPSVADAPGTAPAAPPGAIVSRTAPAAASPASPPALVASAEPLTKDAKVLEALPSNASAEGSDLVIVNVRAKRSALEQKTFDELLRKNNVQFMPTAPGASEREALAEAEAPKPGEGNAPNSTFTDESKNRERGNTTDAAGTLVRGGASGVEAKRSEAVAQEEKQNGNQDVEAVLVVAPPATITSCMEALNRDEANYVSVAVTAPDTRSRELREATVDGAKKADFTRSNRGAAPTPEADRIAQDYYLYFDADPSQSTESFGVDPNTVTGFGTVAQPATGGKAALGTSLATSNGTARRLSAIDGLNTGRYAKAPEAKLDITSLSAGATSKLQAGRRQAPAKVRPDQLKVLFVLRPTDEPAPSLKAKNTPE
jgi:hypothetical protein